MSVALAQEYGRRKFLRRRAGIPRRYGGPLSADASIIYHPSAGFGRQPGYGYVRDVVVVEDGYGAKVPPVKTEVIRDHDRAGYDLPRAPMAPRPARIVPPVKTDVIRDHDEYGYDLPAGNVPVNKPYPPRRPIGYQEVPVAIPNYRKPAVVTHREEHIVKDTPYGVKHEVHESKHIGAAPPHHPDPVADFHYDLEKTPDCAYATNDSICLDDQEYPV